MSSDVHINRIFFLGPFRLSRDANYYKLAAMREKIPDNSFEESVKKILPGLWDAEISFKGATSGEREKDLLTEWVAQTHHVVACQLQTTLELGDYVAVMEAKITGFEWIGDEGARADYQVTLSPEDMLVFAQALWSSVGTAGITAPDATSPGLQLGPLDAGNRLVVAVINPDYPGTTGTTPVLSGRVVSSVDNTFASVTERIVVADLTDTPAAAIYTLDGDDDPVTDEYWRVEWTAVTGTDDPTFFVVVPAAIQPKLI